MFPSPPPASRATQRIRAKNNGEKSKHLAWVTDKRGAILASSWNYNSRHCQGRLGHAERGAIRTLYKRNWDRKIMSGKLTLSVVRVMPDGTLGMSKPCCKCQAYLENLKLNLEVHHS